MFRNYFKIAWRSMLKNRLYALVNIVGLSAGLAFSLLILAYVWSELEVNSNLKNLPQQYIIQSRWKNANEGLELTTFGPLAKALKERYPNLVTGYYRWDGITSTLSTGDKIFREGLQVGDSTFFTMYGFQLLHGDARTALAGPFTMV